VIGDVDDQDQANEELNQEKYGDRDPVSWRVSPTSGRSADLWTSLGQQDFRASRSAAGTIGWSHLSRGGCRRLRLPGSDEHGNAVTSSPPIR